MSKRPSRRRSKHQNGAHSLFPFVTIASLLCCATPLFATQYLAAAASRDKGNIFQRRQTIPHTRRGSLREEQLVNSDTISFWQTRRCDKEWGSWPHACFEPFPRDKLQQLRSRRRPITIWTTEIHPGMRRELETLENLLGVPVSVEYRDLWQLIEVARSCSDERRDGCALPEPGYAVNMTKLYHVDLYKTMDIWHGCPRPRELRRQVFDAFSKHPEALEWSGLARADLLYFSAPVVSFELFLPFDLPMVVQAPYGFELGRDYPRPGGEYYWDTVASWKAASKCASRNASPCKTPKMMASQSPYDVQLMRYTTGEAPLRLPCHGNIHAIKYNGSKSSVVTVAFGSRDYGGQREHIAALGGKSWPWENASQIFEGIPGANSFDFRELRRPFTLEELSTHRAIVLIPYKPAVNFFLEIYSMNMPVFAPSPQFYAELDRDFKISLERLWCGGTPDSAATDIIHRPNDTETFEANKYWNSFGDHFKYPHVVLFDSWSDLVAKLSEADFRRISNEMRKFNSKRKQYIANKWLSFLYDVHAAQRDRRYARSKHWKSLSRTTFDRQTKQIFNVRVGDDASTVLPGCDMDFALGRFDDSKFRGSLEPYNLDYKG